MTNGAFAIQRHEWEYGLSPVPVGLIGLVLLLEFKSFSRTLASLRQDFFQVAMLTLLGGVLLLPLLLNWYEPSWNAFLKRLPFLGASSNLVRWLIVYLPVIIVAAALSLDQIARRSRWSYATTQRVVVGLLGGIIFWTLRSDFDYYHQSYLSAPIEDAWHRAQVEGVPPVLRVAGVVAGNGPNDGLVIGVSAIRCYEPTMGYGLEKFPVGELRAGPVFPVEGGRINLKNPACYLFPEDNQCRPGDHFSPDQSEAARHFASYQPFAFAFSKRQLWANGIAACSWGLALAVLLAWPIQGLFRRSRRVRP